LLRVGLEVRPAGFLGHPEDIDGPVLVRVLRIGSLVLLGYEPGVLLLEGVGDIFEEDQAEYNVFILGGVHVGAERVGGLPQFPFETKVSSVVVPGHIQLSSHRFAISRPLCGSNLCT
jgi:hypothetical protein